MATFDPSDGALACCGEDRRALLVLDGDPRLVVLICDSCHRRTWLRDDTVVTAGEALRTAEAADTDWVSARMEAGRG